jgi:hypothetical protein
MEEKDPVFYYEGTCLTGQYLWKCTKMGEFSETDSIMGVPTEEFPETRKAFV